MPVTLCTSVTAVLITNYDSWCSIGTKEQKFLDPMRKLTGLTAALSEAVDNQARIWWDIAKFYGNPPNSLLSHALQCTTNASDFGLMLGWRHLVESWIKERKHILCVCDDPWLFRELATLNLKAVFKPPSMWGVEWRLFVRGFFARAKVAIIVLMEVIRFSSSRSKFPNNAAVLLVYGHPTSTPQGDDGYFGNLMNEINSVARVLHVDCVGYRARELSRSHHTFSLHAWGQFTKILFLPFIRWRPRKFCKHEPFNWLIRRASALEGGTGQAAMICWQHWCQRAWLDETKPRVVAWPWENHGWERDFVRNAKTLNVRTIGYQHSTVGQREWNYASYSNSDFMLSIPSQVCANGPAGILALKKLGYPKSILVDAGMLRAISFRRLRYDPNGPIFVAVPFDKNISSQILLAIRPLVKKGYNFLIKDHPMTPFQFEEISGITRTVISLENQLGVRAVIYSATTVGLEAVLGGLPTLCFLPDQTVTTDPMPEGIEVPVATSDTLEEILNSLDFPPYIDPYSIFSPPNFSYWKTLFASIN